ncbi:5-(carboxyamino)imidazole ribonucleotide mutase [Pigmentibacter sp. JX0631]|uniref:5-(carboxyamino)imidazole ribonucleotide mutase n=1 Tax=Pigmentibacter sp. JX0631 TaxID=2976982 RepID=UPI00246849D0|nr:5-(carboxyamino)imidazole ribonucleotide mutase [Pigmentibacter sp. JX0631]WGL59409.1 5-(carboxyamino)imidazole ribonucleotide mutase [Pigmentibacter sp. JX0631]
MHNSPIVSIIMGSQSDYETLKYSENICAEFDIPYEIQIISAHRTPKLMFDYAESVKTKGIKVIIAGAGGAAHLPGMVSGLTLVPVLAVPVQSKALNGLDSLLSIVQMPGGIPTATFAIGQAGAVNAALFAIQILAMENDALFKKLEHWRTMKSMNALEGNQIVQEKTRKNQGKQEP